MARKKKFGRYEIQAEIGQGAMGKVYKAFDPLTQRPVAIKAIKEEILAQDETGDYLRRFQREARAAGGLSHPNIITIFDVGENYFVMEYLEGKNLLNILSERGPLSLDETLQVVSPIAAALTYAHGKGVYHRDIKPANIMVFPDGRSVITDFGLAHLESTSRTTAGQFLGSPSYMSPEQIMGHEMTPQSDVFSLSVVTYEMLTGQKPFPGENITTVVYKVVHSPPVPPHEHNPVLPADYKEIFECALAKNPSARFASFAELVAALNLKEFDRLELPVATPTDTDVFDPIDEEKLHLATDVFRKITQGGFVVLWQDDPLEIGTTGGQNLFLDAANREYESRNGDLARHSRILPNGLLAVERRECGRDRNARGRTVLRNGARGYVHVHALVLEVSGAQTELLRMGPQETLSGSRRLLHHAPELPGQRETAAPGKRGGFDIEHIATRFGPGEPGGHTGGHVASRLLEVKALRSEHLGKVVGRDRHRLRLALRENDRRLSSQAPDHALKLP